MKLVNFINYIGNNMSLSREEITKAYFGGMLKDKLNNITNELSETDFETHGFRGRGKDKRISPTEWHIHYEIINTKESRLTGRLYDEVEDRWEKLSIEDSLKREEVYNKYVMNSAIELRKYSARKQVERERYYLTNDNQATSEEVMSFLNGWDEECFEKNKFYMSCERYLEIFDKTRREEEYFGRKAGGGLYSILTDRVKEKKETLAKEVAKKNSEKTFNFEVKYGEYEIFSEEGQDEIISNLLLELGYNFDELDDDWEIKRKNFNLKVEFGDNYSFKVSFSKKGLLEIGSMGRNRLKIKEIN